MTAREVIQSLMGNPLIFKSPRGVLKESSIREIDKIIDKYQRDDKYGGRLVLPTIRQLVSYYGDDWDLYDNGVVLHKRYAKYVNDNIGIKVPSEIYNEIARIGGLDNREAIYNEYVFDIVDTIDWEAGDFGENEGSCWWTDYTGAREGLSDSEDGFALRRFESLEGYELDNSYGVGRMWICTDGDYITTFNGYDKEIDSPTKFFSTLLANHLGMDIYGVGIKVKHAYINMDNGYCITSKSTLKQYSFSLHFARKTGSICCECNNCIGDGDEYEFDGNTYCEDCYYENVFECDHCGNLRYTCDEVAIQGGNCVCQRCADNYYIECNHCNELVESYDEVDGEYYCDDCYRELFTYCKGCGEIVHTEEIEDNLCEYCREKKEDVDEN